MTERNNTGLRRKRQQPVDFKLNEERLAYAEAHGWDVDRAELELDRFVFYHASDRFADWDAGWRFWVASAAYVDRKSRYKQFLRLIEQCNGEPLTVGSEGSTRSAKQ